MSFCAICGEEHADDEMLGEVCVSCASILHAGLEFEC
jgi:hypothetical protein